MFYCELLIKAFGYSLIGTVKKKEKKVNKTADFEVGGC